MGERRIRVFLADDCLLAREGIRALIESYGDLEVVGVASELQTSRSREGAGARRGGHQRPGCPRLTAGERGRLAEDPASHPGTGIVVLSQYVDPEAARLPSRRGVGAPVPRLLKGRVAESGRLAPAVRRVVVQTGAFLLPSDRGSGTGRAADRTGAPAAGRLDGPTAGQPWSGGFRR
jgi:adenylate cyclase